MLKWIWVIPFWLILATVFVDRPELAEGVISGKYFWFYAAMGTVAMTVVLRQSVHPVPVQIGIADRLLLLYGIFTLSVSAGLHHSEAVTKHILLILVILLYFYFKQFLSIHKSGIYWLVLFFLFTGAAEAYWGLRQLYGFSYSRHYLFRMTGSFFNPGPYACYLAVVIPAAFGYLLRDWSCTKVKFRLRYRQLYLRWGMALLTCAGAVLVLPAAMSRSAWLAAAGGCGIILYSKIRGFTNSKIQNRFAGKFSPFQRVLFSCFLAVLIVLGGIGMYRMKKDSADGRALMWKIALQTAIHHPMGVGIGNFSGSYGHTQADYFAAGKGTEQEQHVAGNPEYGFNEYLQIAVEQGMIPLVLFLGIMGYSVYTGIRRRRMAATASLVALLIVATASYPFSVLPFLVVLAFLLAWIHSGFRNSGIQKFKDSKIQRFRCWKWIGLALVAGCLYSRYPTYQAYKQWGRSRMLYHAGAYESGSEAYTPLYPLLSDQLTFLFEYAQCLSRTEHYEESNRILEKAVHIGCDPMLYNVTGKNHQALKQYAEAERCFLKAAHIVPSRIYPWYLLVNLYMETDETAKACAMAEIVLTKEPKVQSTAVREMREKTKSIIQDSIFSK